MHAEYRWILAHLAAEPDVRAVVVTGTPPAFCVGGDAEALAGHAERGAYDAGLPADAARPGYGVRPELDHDFAFQFALPYVADRRGQRRRRRRRPRRRAVLRPALRQRRRPRSPPPRRGSACRPSTA